MGPGSTIGAVYLRLKTRLDCVPGMGQASIRSVSVPGTLPLLMAHDHLGWNSEPCHPLPFLLLFPSPLLSSSYEEGGGACSVPSWINSQPHRNPHISVATCFEITRSHLMRPFSQEALDVQLPASSLGPHPSYLSVRISPGLSFPVPSRSLLQQASPFPPASSTFSPPGVQKHHHSKCPHFSHIKKEQFLDPTLLSGSVSH